jgi:hypothetical protein
VDEHTRLLLQKAGRTSEWEDEEQANYDLEILRQEFRKRLYADQTNGSAEGRQDQRANEKT